MAGASRTWIEISGATVRHNLAAVQRVIGKNVNIMPIVKANAYGHGLPEVLNIVRGQTHWGLGVAYGEEALQARALNYHGRIAVLSNWQAHGLPELIRKNTEIVVWDNQSLNAVLQVAHRLPVKPKVHIKLDTGTTRIGFLGTDVGHVSRVLASKDINVVGIFSHFANSEESSAKRTLQQLQRFTTLSNKIDPKQGAQRHIACTAAMLRYPEARFGLVRLGIGLYGLLPSTQIQAWSRANIGSFYLQPVLSWYTRLAQVKTVASGTAVGYGSTFITRRTTRIGIVPVGYADGYDRRLSNRGWVVIHGRRAPILGRVCMNLSMVDVTNVAPAKSGDLVTLIGRDVSADDLADLIGTIHYEVTTRINWSLPRVVV